MRPRFTFLAAFTLAIAAMMTAANAQGYFPIGQPAPSGAYLGDLARTQPAAKNPVQEALAQLKKAKGDEEKQAAQAKLDEALGKLFDADIKRREAELVAIQQRLKQMQTLLRKRIENKENIIALRAQVLTSQAEGLGWQEGNSRRRSGVFFEEFGAPTAWPQPSNDGAPIGLPASRP